MVSQGALTVCPVIHVYTVYRYHCGLLEHGTYTHMFYVLLEHGTYTHMFYVLLVHGTYTHTIHMRITKFLHFLFFFHLLTP